MKRITLSLAALALMLVAADTASAQTTIRVVGGTTYYPAPVYTYPSTVYTYPGTVYTYPTYSYPVYSSYPVYTYPRSSVYYGNGWGGNYSGFSIGNRNFGYSSYSTPWGGYSGVRVRIR